MLDEGVRTTLLSFINAEDGQVTLDLIEGYIAEHELPLTVTVTLANKGRIARFVRERSFVNYGGECLEEVRKAESGRTMVHANEIPAMSLLLSLAWGRAAARISYNSADAIPPTSS